MERRYQRRQPGTDTGAAPAGSARRASRGGPRAPDFSRAAPRRAARRHFFLPSPRGRQMTNPTPAAGQAMTATPPTPTPPPPPAKAMTPPPATATVRRLDADEAAASVAALADVLIDCVQGGASVSFMWPLPRDKALAVWRTVAEGGAGNEGVLLVAQDPHGGIVGTVQLVTAMPDNQPHRADVAKMLVHRKARRQGLARRLLAAVEDAARAEGRTVLVLDTVTGGDAERLYRRAGWQQVGMVPDYALMPDGAFCSTTFFYKRLRGPDRCDAGPV